MCKPCIYPNIMHTEVIQYNMQWSATTPKVLFFFFFFDDMVHLQYKPLCMNCY